MVFKLFPKLKFSGLVIIKKMCDYNDQGLKTYSPTFINGLRTHLDFHGLDKHL